MTQNEKRLAGEKEALVSSVDFCQGQLIFDFADRDAELAPQVDSLE